MFDIWKCLSRVYPDGDRILITNFKRIFTAMVGLIKKCDSIKEPNLNRKNLDLT